MNRALFIGSTAFLALVVALEAVEPLALGSARPGAAEAFEATPDDVAPQGAAREAPPEERVGPRIFEAAREFVRSLSEEQSRQCLAAFRDPGRFDWHFVPRGREGLALKEMGEAETAAFWKLLDASLSETGSKRVRQVIELERILRRIEGPGGSIVRDPGLYHVRLFGRPSEDAEWAWRLEGHHLSIHFTLKGTRLVAATPSFYGANPAIVRDGPEAGLRVLAGVEDAARRLLESLDERQRKTCIGEAVPQEVPETGKARYAGPFPAGVTLAEVSDEGRSLFRELVREYTACLPASFARALEQRIAGEDAADIHFAWRGETKPLAPHSYMAHGKTFVINYSNVQNGGAHVHSVLRERANDFGPDVDRSGTGR